MAAAACSSTRPATQLHPTAAAPSVQVEPPDPRVAATDHFYRGKTYALSGDADCARLEFGVALETFREQQRPGHPEDFEFGAELYESIRLYQDLTEGRAESDERPPVENTRDSLIAGAPAPSPEELETAKKEVAGSESAATFDIPVVVNDSVLRALAYYQFRTPKHFAAALQRSGRYLPLMRALLKERGLPQDLVYVAMIESAFKQQAHSRKSAHGYWQFIQGTAKRYGLKMSHEVDERSDPVKSTIAAAGYFRDLYEIFGDWHLAMAAYDAGEGKILRGLQRTGARNFWELAAGGFLHRETRDYVPFVMAAALIGRDPARFGFDVVPDPPLEFDSVIVTRPTDLRRIAVSIGCDLEDLRLLNGELKTHATPHGGGAYALRVPKGAGPVLEARLGSLPPAPEAEERKVRARKGDTLAKVGARYKVSVAELCDLNELTPASRLRKGALLLIPVRSAATASSSRSREERIAATTPPSPIATAAQGEIRALPTPAAAVTSASLLGAQIVPSATLATAPVSRPLPSRIDIPAEGFETVPASPRTSVNPHKASPASTASSTPSEKRRKTYTVRSGDTLYRIAESNGTTVDALRKENRLGRREPLRIGRTLTLPTRAAAR